VKDGLSATETKVYSYISSFKPNTDIDIKCIYYAVYHKEPDSSNRTVQQTVGAFISRINQKLEGAEIKPGRMKKTYRLVPVKPTVQKA
jgi:hypothetical protein